MSQNENNTPRSKQLMQIFVADGEPEQTLPPLEGREIMTSRTKAIGKTDQEGRVIHQEGTVIYYSKTLSELTRAVNNLEHRLSRTVQDFSMETKRFQALTDLPEQVKDFHKRLEELIVEVNQALQEVWEALNDLLAGKAKPNDETLNLVMQVLQQLQDRVQNLESRSRPQVGNSSRSRT